MIRRLTNEASETFVSSDSMLTDTDSTATIQLVNTARRVLEIVPGERRLIPEFGCRVHSLESFGSSHARCIGAELIADALRRWAPQLAARRVEIDGYEDGLIHASIWVPLGRCSFRIRHRAPQPASELTADSSLATDRLVAGSRGSVSG